MPTDLLEQVVNPLAHVKRIHKGRVPAEVQPATTRTNQVILDPCELRADRPNDLAPWCQLDVKQPLAHVVPGDVVGHRRHVVQPVRDHHVLVVIKMLAQLLEPAVQVADVHRAAQDLLAVQLEHVAQRGVGGRVLRAHIQNPYVAPRLLRSVCRRPHRGPCLYCRCHVQNAEFRIANSEWRMSPLHSPFAIRFPLTSSCALARYDLKVFALAAASKRIILPERMRLEPFPRDDATQVRMSRKPHAE